MITSSERRKPWLATLLAMLLAAPGIPMSGAPPQRDTARMDIIAKSHVRIGKDSLEVDVPVKGRDGRPRKGWLVELILPSFGAGLVSDSGETTLRGETGDDGHKRFSSLRANNIPGRFEIRVIVRDPGPNGETLNKKKTLRNVKGFVLFGLSVKQLISIAAGGAVVAGIVAVTNNGSDKPITPVPPGVVGPPIGPASRRPR